MDINSPKNSNQIIVTGRSSFVKTGWESSSSIYSNDTGATWKYYIPWETFLDPISRIISIKTFFSININSGYACIFGAVVGGWEYYNSIYKFTFDTAFHYNILLQDTLTEKEYNWGNFHSKFTNLCFMNNEYGFVTKQDGKLYRTTNGGKNWDKKNFPDFYNGFYSIFYLDKNEPGTWIASGASSKYLKTIDSGITWKEFPWVGEFMQFSNNKKLGVGYGTRYVNTSFDEGANWSLSYKESDSLIYDYNLNNIAIPPNQNEILYVMNSNGFILKGENLTDVYESSKPGQNLEISPNPSESYIYINLPVEFLAEKIKIYSVEGIEMYNSSCSGTGMPVPYDGNRKIDVSSFFTGVYYVKIGDRVCRFVKI